MSVFKKTASSKNWGCIEDLAQQTAITILFHKGDIDASVKVDTVSNGPTETRGATEHFYVEAVGSKYIVTIHLEYDTKIRVKNGPDKCVNMGDLELWEHSIIAALQGTDRIMDILEPYVGADITIDKEFNHISVVASAGNHHLSIGISEIEK